MKKQVRILKGLHLGAEALIEEGSKCVIGSDPSCSVMLCDPDVAPKHCVITADAFGITCRAVEAPITIDGRQIAVGQAVSIADFQTIHCGTAAFSIGPADTQWSKVDTASLLARSQPISPLSPVALRRVNPMMLLAGMVVGVIAVLGLTYAALSDRSELTPRQVEAARKWLSSVAPAGSELDIKVENQAYLLLSGYVPTNYQRELVTIAANDSRFKPRVEIIAVDEMMSSMLRLAQLEGLQCVPKYAGAGNVACTNEVASDAIVMRLQAIAKQVPGLIALDVKANPNVVVAEAPKPEPKKEVESTPGRITKKFSVVVFKKNRYLVGEYGDKYAEGDEFDGFTIEQIGVDRVIFKREGREYSFYVASIGAANDGDSPSRSGIAW